LEFCLRKKALNKQMVVGYIFAILATALWSGNFIVARGLNESIPPISLAFFRWLVAILVFLPFAIKPLLGQIHIIKINLLYLCIVSILGVSIFNTLIYFAGQTTTAINLSLISITFPIFILILSRIFFGELITINKSIGILFVALGIVLLISKGDISVILNITFTVGDIWMFGAAIVFAIYSILLKYRPKDLNILAFQLCTFILGLIFLIPFFIWEYNVTPPFELNTEIITSILYVGIFASLLAFILWNKAIDRIGSIKAGMIYYTLPIFSGFLAYVFLNESIGMIHMYSVLSIAVGIFVANYELKKQHKL